MAYQYVPTRLMLPTSRYSKSRADHAVNFISNARWWHQGHLEATEGSVIYYDFIEKKITELREQFNIVEIGYDAWGAGQMRQNLEREGFTMVSIHQGFKSLTEPTKELYRLVVDKRLIHGGHPVLRWHFENVTVESDAAGNIKPSKDKSEEKIDGAVATIMALSRAVHAVANPPKRSVYETRGIITIGDDDDFDW